MRGIRYMKRTDRGTEKQGNRETVRQRDRGKERRRDRESMRIQRNIVRGRQIYNDTERLTNRVTDRETKLFINPFVRDITITVINTLKINCV